MFRTLIVALGLLCAVGITFAAPPAALQAAIDARLNDAALKDARIGVFVQSLDHGDIWYDRQANARFIPASNTKIVTAILALEHLKPEYRFTTRFLTDGTRKGDTLDGNLYVQGGGDPSLTVNDLRDMAALLCAGDADRNQSPLRAITGRIILDSGFFPGKALLGQGWVADDLTWYYAAPSDALSLNRNAVKLTVRGTKAMQHPTIILDPPTAEFIIHSSVRTSSRVKTGAIDVQRRGRDLYISGQVAPGAELTERISVPQPMAFFAEQLRAALQAQGATVGATAAGAADLRTMNLLVEHNSAPLRELITTMLKDSDNHYAEQLYWSLLSLYSVEKPLDQRYMALLQDFLAHTGQCLTDMQIVDGSGLSRLNCASPAALVDLLTYIAGTPQAGDFIDALPIAGIDGTLKTRMCDLTTPGCVRAKTGTMRGISCLSGYVTTAGGERLVFSIMLNDYRSGAAAARKLQDDVVSLLAKCGQAQ